MRNSMKPESEIWQVMTQGEIYQADLTTLKEWVVEGLVQATDTVRKGELRWIEAGRAPVLRRVFTGDEKIVPRETPPDAAANVVAAAAPVIAGEPPAHVPAHHAAESRATFTESVAEPPVEASAEPFLMSVPTSATGAAAAVASPLAGCWNHPQQTPAFVCRECFTAFCRPCTKFVKNTEVALCEPCGGLCRPYEDVKGKQDLFEQQSASFGLADFKRALAYPFQHRISLAFGAGLYGLMLLSGIRGRVLAFAALFGCISIVINKVACGKFNGDFLPDFSSFNFLDDVLMPALLGLGVTIVALGPVILLMLALLFGWLGGLKSQATQRAADERLQQMQRQAHEEAQKITGKELNPEDIDAIASGNAEQQRAATEKLKLPVPERTTTQKLEQADDGHDMLTTFAIQLLQRPGLMLLLGVLSIAWAVFYYPMALAVAGYTEDFKSVINPLVGLDTIRHMGSTYAKAFGMYLAVQIVALIISLGVGVITAPFDMPFFGNLPATFINGMVTFYASLVIACVLGLALFKSADKLGIEV